MSEPKGERPARRNGNRTSNNGGMRFSRGLFGWFLFLALCAALFLLLNNRGGQYISLNMGDVLTQLKEGNVKNHINPSIFYDLILFFDQRLRR